MIIHHREQAFFHLASIPCTADHRHAGCQVEENKVLGVKSLLLPVGVGCLRCHHHHEVGFEAFEILLLRPYEHVFHEMGLPCHLHNESDRKTGILVGPAETVNNEKTFSGKLFCSKLPAVFPNFDTDWFVIRDFGFF